MFFFALTPPKTFYRNIIVMTKKQIEAHPYVDEVLIDNSRGMRGHCYRVLIYIKTELGVVAEDGTSTLYGRNLKEAAKGLAEIRKGELV